MPNLSTVETRLLELEKRVKLLEQQLSAKTEEQKLMDTLYEAAKQLVAQHNKASVIFLQRKMLIDLPRAKALLDRLKAEGIVK